MIIYNWVNIMILKIYHYSYFFFINYLYFKFINIILYNLFQFLLILVAYFSNFYNRLLNIFLAKN